MSPEYTETVFPVNVQYANLDVPRMLGGGDYAGMDFPSNLKRLRKAAGLTQSELAEKLEVSQPSVQRWENGKREPSYADLFAIAEALESPVGELFSDVGKAAGADTPPPAWIPKEETLSRLARAAQRAASENPGRPFDVQRFARGLYAGLRMLAMKPASEDDPGYLNAVETQIVIAAHDYTPPPAEFPEHKSDRN